MSPTIRLLLVIHNHQPVGNFEGVIEQAYQDSYLPFLDVFEQYRHLPLALHTSGCLMEWLDANHPEYIDRLRELVAHKRVEIVGGAFYEPILTMIPSHDRVGQIRAYTEWLTARLGAEVRGLWIPERVWEQALVSDLSAAGMQYTFLDDFHFKTAGVPETALRGYYVTEDNGELLRVFPGSERLRYLIPFAAPQETIDELASIAQEQPGAVVVFADDGEKFGTWPDTKAHVYERGWLTEFFRLLEANRDWIDVSTPSAVLADQPPAGSVYLPEASYREMTEWVLPTDQLLNYQRVKRDWEQEGKWEQVAPFVRGGYWRNFKTKYPESAAMYARMQQLSRQLRFASEQQDVDQSLLQQARQELYRGQCNCSYWHGAFGGIYLPHLRNAIYQHLIKADTLLHRAAGRDGHWIEAHANDFNLDGRSEIQVATDKLVAAFAPSRGGALFELDVRAISHNLLATLARRPEAYHQQILRGPDQGGDHVASIHDRVVFKQEGLERRLQYDSYARYSLLDHFYAQETTLAEAADGEASELGDFVGGVYETRLGRKEGRARIQLNREGLVAGSRLRVTKAVTLNEGSSTLEIAYALEGLPANRVIHFAPEFNFAGLPGGASDRYFLAGVLGNLGPLDSRLDLEPTDTIHLIDEWLGIDVGFTFEHPAHVWTYPVATVSQSEGGFELVHQSVVVQPHWYIQVAENEVWRVVFTLELDTRLAESRMPAVTSEAVQL